LHLMQFSVTTNVMRLSWSMSPGRRRHAYADPEVIRVTNCILDESDWR
jgi:hypothetical protein